MKEEHNQCPTVVTRIYSCGNITFLFDCTHMTVPRPALLHTTGFCFSSFFFLLGFVNGMKTLSCLRAPPLAIGK